MNKSKSKTQEAICPSCGGPVELEKDVEAGDIAYCVDCDQELKVLKINPPKLKAVAVHESPDGLYQADDDDSDPSPEEEEAAPDDAYDEDTVDDTAVDDDDEKEADGNGRGH